MIHFEANTIPSKQDTPRYMLPQHLQQNNYMYTSIYDVSFLVWYQINVLRNHHGPVCVRLKHRFLIPCCLSITSNAYNQIPSRKYKPDIAKKRRLRYQRDVVINNHWESKIEKWFDEGRQRECFHNELTSSPHQLKDQYENVKSLRRGAKWACMTSQKIQC